MNKIIIAGSRNFNNYELMCTKLDKILSRLVKEGISIVSGCARGADQLGEKYAKDKGYEVLKFPADWDRWRKSAGYKRNVQMAENATHCVVFWDGISKGSEHMINIAKEHGLQIRVIKYTLDKFLEFDTIPDWTNRTMDEPVSE